MAGAAATTGRPSASGGGRRPRRISTRGAVLAALIGALLLSGVYQVRPYLQTKADLGALLTREQRLDREIARLEAAKKRLASDGEIERLAREQLGMVRPGETAFVVPPERRAAGPEPPAFPEPRKQSGRPWYARVWHWLVDVPIPDSSSH